MWRCEDVKMWRYEDVEMWEFGDYGKSGGVNVYCRSGKISFVFTKMSPLTPLQRRGELELRKGNTSASALAGIGLPKMQEGTEADASLSGGLRQPKSAIDTSQ